MTVIIPMSVWFPAVLGHEKDSFNRSCLSHFGTHTVCEYLPWELLGMGLNPLTFGVDQPLWLKMIRPSLSRKAMRMMREP